MTNDKDIEFMDIALKQAYESFSRGDFPVGAVITIENKFLGMGNNSIRTNENWVDHAENQLIDKYGVPIQKAKRNNEIVTIYTSLEPCLMCLGTCVMNRVSRVVYACPDPNGGATKLNPHDLGEWYVKKWPKIEMLEDGKVQSYDLIIANMNQTPQRWGKTLDLFKEMRKSWD